MPGDSSDAVRVTNTGLSNTRGAAMYVGALLGPSLLLLPGLAAHLAGPASVLAWAGMLVVSALLAWVFAALGVRFGGSGGVVGYVRAGLGTRAGRATGWSFLAGVVLGAPVVCLIGGAYVADLVGGGRLTTVVAAVVLLAAVVGLTLGGARASTTVQLVLVAVLVALVAVAVVGGTPSARAANWTPFLPHGWTSIGSASAVLMLSFVGWEAIAPLTSHLRDPRRQLPCVIGAAFAVTATVYLALAVTAIGVLGPAAGSTVPLADLLQAAVGAVGRGLATVAAVALTLAATNAYLTGAAALATELTRDRRRGPVDTRLLQLGIVVTGVVLFAAVAFRLVGTADFVTLPTALFLAVYLGCTAAAVRVLDGPVRIAAAVAFVAVAVVFVFAFTGWAVAVAMLVAAAGFLAPSRRDDAFNAVRSRFQRDFSGRT
ncbi:MAG: amino acid permease [Streptosporangiales bacterium]|nr:amino acid permease [Streptosporangiales bacterium]